MCIVVNRCVGLRVQRLGFREGLREGDPKIRGLLAEGLFRVGILLWLGQDCGTFFPYSWLVVDNKLCYTGTI